MSDTKFRWGILGPGSIAKKFATGLTVLPGHELVAVGSTSQERADAFAAEFGAGKAYGSHEELVADPEIDAIYAARPHTMHAQDALRCIEAGKPVIVEKPFTVNERQARSVVDAARSKGVFVLEAMWSRFFPLTREVRKLVADGAVGEPRMLQCDFGFRAGVNPEGRLFNPALAGGGLLDVGVYALSFSSMIFGEPTKIASLAQTGSTGVDEQCAAVLMHKGGEISMVAGAIRTTTPQEAWIVGTDGKIRIPCPFWNPRSYTLSRGGQDEVHEIAVEGNGYEFEALEVEKCVRAGLVESPDLPLDETISIVRTMDIMRAQWGLKYPGEE